MKRIMQKIMPAVLILLATFGTPLLAYTPAYAATAQQDICQGLAAGGASCTGSGSSDTVNKTIRLAINLFSMVVGVAAVIMIIVGGFKYIISSGDSNGINSAKNTILYALVGLVVVALAQVIVKFVLTKTK